MAEPSDILGEVVEVAAEHDTSFSGPLHRNLDDVRRKKDSARRMEALSLRLAGLTYEQIAERLDMSKSGAIDLVNRTLNRAENQAVDQMRDLEATRLDRAQAAIWTRVLEGDAKAVDTFLRISQRRAKLFGLDAPTAINLNVGIRNEMEQALTHLQNIVLGKVVSSHYEDSDESPPPAIES
jgi:transposase